MGQTTTPGGEFRKKKGKRMNQTINRYLNVFDRTDEFIAQGGITLKPRSTVLIAQIRSIRDELLAKIAEQNGGYSLFRAGAFDRVRTATSLREWLINVAYTSRTLDPDQYPAAAQMVRVTRSRGYQALRANAQAFLDAIAPIKAAFVEREFPADFDEIIQGLVAELDASTQRRNGGLRKRTEGTAGQMVLSRQGMTRVRELDAMLCQQLKVSNPALYAAWKAASRVGRSAAPEPAEASSGEAPAASVPAGSTPTA